MFSVKQLAVIVVGILILFGGYFWLRDRQVSGEAVGKSEFERLQNENDSLKLVLKNTKASTDTASKTVTKTIIKYDTLRKRIVFTDTSRFVIVDTQFVVTADSVKKACTVLDLKCAEERAASGRVIANQVGQIRAQQTIIDNQPGFLRRVGDWAVGGSVGYLACKVIR